eukprot:TRINITY_DN7709_c0_g1_i1.p1 TRINITY_DN7709_c0_g1~~TRINITY_DN7709_c0_g1_i1.p1  ORF type:complete len:219 (+),score=98.77 TRINITY_DN7709_c0_g1_i1:2-658(+)
MSDAAQAIQLATDRLISLVSEDTSSWKVLDSKNADVQLWEKEYDIPRIPPPSSSTPALRVAKAVIKMKSSKEAIQEIASNLDLQKQQWDVPTIMLTSSIIETLADGISVAYLPYKTLSASISKRDLVAARKSSDAGDAKIWVSTSCTSTKSPTDPSLVRANLILSGFYIEQEDGETCKVTMIHCLDYTGWIHDKFVDADIARCALRLSKIRAIAVTRK